MGSILEILANILMSFSMFGGEPSDEKIEKNIMLLKELDWFKEIYQNDQYKELIKTNVNVRYAIGTSNVKSAKKYQKVQLRIQKKIMETIKEESEK
ncbi:hypothetical protein JMM81_20160 [Bacillus sp. V3B]|uniref:hypothetical protein n=1 Tax=Bacillus sp. V3B TaxID=2804915 RepID=UPI00210C2569|nr:hypothetical protein [Bacillus sp. V3B]MCQ6277192.1 hypothetical protein [Bacillus sp. V3B]